MNNKFVFIAPAFNAEETVQQMLASIFFQSYDNWKIVIIDDVSTDNTVSKINNVIYSLAGVTATQGATANFWWIKDTKKIEIIKNTEKKWEVANVLEGVKLCDDDDVICRIDCDDFLCDLDALRFLNEVYNQTKADFVWTKHRWVDHKRITDFNISGPLNARGDDVYKHSWVTSHLKTMRKYLFNEVNDVNFRGVDGEYIKRAGDQAITLPCLRNAKNPVFFPKVLYSYYCNMDPETFQTDDAKFQASEAEFLRKRGYVK